MSGRDQRQQVVAKWAAEAFGIEQATSLPQRGVRLLEEAVEAAQSVGTSREMAHKLVDYVFDRPAGQLGQEIGGVSVTLLALAAAAALSADDCEQLEISRILAKPIDHYTKRNQAKNAAGFLATDDAVAPRMVRPTELPASDAVIDYGNGACGPVMLHWAAEGDDVVNIMREAGFDCLYLEMHDDLGAEHQLCIDHFEYGASDTLTKWTPTEQGHGWKLVGKFDSEDGPTALFVRPLPQEPAHG